MKAEELRIGNWVNNEYGQPEQVECIHELGINIDLEDQGAAFHSHRVIVPGTKWEDVSGIPITPEWLERLGYRQTMTDYWEWRLPIDGRFVGVFKLQHGRLRQMDKGMAWKEVHRLQNWMAETFHALTGSELKEKT